MPRGPRATPVDSLYSTFTRVLAIAAWCFCALFAFNLVTTGTASLVWHFLPGLLLAAWGVYLLLWRPCLQVFEDRLVVKNILRDHAVPFQALKDINVRQVVSLETTAGRISSWGAPGMGKMGPRIGRASGPGAKTVGVTEIPQVQRVVEKAWKSWAEEPSENTSAGDFSAVEVSGGANVSDGVVLGVLVLLTLAGFIG